MKKSTESKIRSRSTKNVVHWPRTLTLTFILSIYSYLASTSKYEGDANILAHEHRHNKDESIV